MNRRWKYETRILHIKKPGYPLYLALILLCALFSQLVYAENPRRIQKGQILPNAKLVGTRGQTVAIEALKGRIKIFSVVPQLNTPVCDEQTHRFSEDRQSLDPHIEIVTISTNTYDDQAHFASKAKIHNLTYLSDSPNYDFGKKTGLLIPTHGILHRTVLVVDHNNVIRYIEHVPMSQLPNFDGAYRSISHLLKNHRQ